MDIDIDTPSTFDPSTIFNGTPASKLNNSELLKHPSGFYFQNMPEDPLTKLAAIPYDNAENFGFFKIDFLHLTFLDKINSKQELREYIKQDPDWSLLQRREVVEQLFQIHKQFDFISNMAPQSVDDLADCLALLRPGKKHLLTDYLRDKQTTRKRLYQKTDKYYYKKGHAISYALTIVVQLHIIKKQKKLYTSDDLFEY